ncbi:hypothetical protein NMH_1412 [Neisseria meningitidis H44/76]|uniref:Uncharacterized protein n=4 Tax=Neisseria meningitidis TaxID=487 RepID=E6MXK7_NEIMH|nr:hypothetical protein NMH_1412 [Neisseria meningitidis H44/76]KER40463.1 hypothetical protein F528_0570 [Neisseria meningitidis 992008]CBA06217.1 hypothetical protein predicted by Glimmer/Critica [Neisseria meningitidis alpha275]CBA06549.1 hypothetical protein predicted by Glimmer/Critica [Neisseria meningitidis alpha153]CCA44054.1 hypothetical protein NMALPHA522_0513 [Neisseria meningitidis alpha522]
MFGFSYTAACRFLQHSSAQICHLKALDGIFHDNSRPIK